MRYIITAYVLVKHEWVINAPNEDDAEDLLRDSRPEPDESGEVDWDTLTVDNIVELDDGSEEDHHRSRSER